MSKIHWIRYDGIWKHICRSSKNIRRNNDWINMIRSADDIANNDRNEQVLKNLIDEMGEVMSNEHNIKINKTETKVTIYDKMNAQRLVCCK